MKTGYVVGRVWATKRLSEMPSGALLEIDLEDPAGAGASERLVAFDPLGCGDGERVLVTQGSVAKGWFKDSGVVIDALVIGSLDEVDDPKPARGKARAKKS